MTPSDTDGIEFYQGAPWEKRFNFTDANGDTIDLTPFAPFKCEVKTNDMNTLLATATIAGAGIGGYLDITFTDNQTSTFPLTGVRFGLIDNLNNPYVDGQCPVKRMTATPTIV